MDSPLSLSSSIYFQKANNNGWEIKAEGASRIRSAQERDSEQGEASPLQPEECCECDPGVAETERSGTHSAGDTAHSSQSLAQVQLVLLPLRSEWDSSFTTATAQPQARSTAGLHRDVRSEDRRGTGLAERRQTQLFWKCFN